MKMGGRSLSRPPTRYSLDALLGFGIRHGLAALGQAGGLFGVALGHEAVEFFLVLGTAQFAQFFFELGAQFVD